MRMNWLLLSNRGLTLSTHFQAPLRGNGMVHRMRFSTDNRLNLVTKYNFISIF